MFTYSISFNQQAETFDYVITKYGVEFERGSAPDYAAARLVAMRFQIEEVVRRRCPFDSYDTATEGVQEVMAQLWRTFTNDATTAEQHDGWIMQRAIWYGNVFARHERASYKTLRGFTSLDAMIDGGEHGTPFDAASDFSMDTVFEELSASHFIKVLSPELQQVAIAIAAGARNAEIARWLGVSKPTITARVKAIRAKYLELYGDPNAEADMVAKIDLALCGAGLIVA